MKHQSPTAFQEVIKCLLTQKLSKWRDFIRAPGSAPHMRDVAVFVRQTERDEWTERLRKNLSVFLFSKQFQFLRKINKCSWAVMWFLLWWHSDDIIQSFSTSTWISIDTFPVIVLNEVLKTTWDPLVDLSGSCGSSRRPASSSLWGTTRRIPAGGSRREVNMEDRDENNTLLVTHGGIYTEWSECETAEHLRTCEQRQVG